MPKSLGVSTEKINISIPPERDIGVAVTGDNRFFVRYEDSDKAIEGKYFDNEEDAMDFADLLDSRMKNQETFAINVTPKMKEKAKSGIPLFGFGGAIGAGSTMGALGNMPSTQDNET